MQYDDSETRSEGRDEFQAAAKHIAVGNCAIQTCRLLLVLCMLLILAGLAAWTMTDIRRYPLIPGVKTIKEEPYNSLVSATLRKAGGLGDRDTYGGPPSPPKEREVALSAHDIVRVQRSAERVLNVSCGNQRVRKSRHSIYVWTTMWQVKDDIPPTSVGAFDPHYRMLFTYTTLHGFVQRMRFMGFQIVVILTMLANSPAVVFDLKTCNLPQFVWLVENPVINDPQVNLTNGKVVSAFNCEDIEIREYHLRKVRVKVDVDLNVKKEWMVVKICFGDSPNCPVIFNQKVDLELYFYAEEVEAVIMVDTLAKYLLKGDTANIETWCELHPQ